MVLGLTTGVAKSRNPSPNPDVTIRTIGRRCVTNAKHLRLETKSYKSQHGVDDPHWMQYSGPIQTNTQTLSLCRAITVLHRIIKCLNSIIHSNMDLHRVYTNEFWVFTASTYCGIGGARCNPSPWEDKIGEKPVLLYIGFV